MFIGVLNDHCTLFFRVVSDDGGTKTIHHGGEHFLFDMKESLKYWNFPDIKKLYIVIMSKCMPL
jgi:hypothetical protein